MWKAVSNLVIGLILLLAVLLGIPQDAYRAYHKTTDRWRLFMYYQTARHFGVPEALDRYGAEPKNK